MTSELSHAVKDRTYPQSQPRTKFPRDSEGFQCLNVEVLAAKLDRLVQGHAERDVGVFEFASVGVIKLSFPFRQEGTPILLNRVIPAGRRAGTHRSLQERGVYTRNCVYGKGLSCGAKVPASILAVYFERVGDRGAIRTERPV